MSQILPHLRTRSGEPIGQEIFFQFPDIFSNQRTFLDADANSGITSLTANGVNFGVSQYIVIGQPGDLKTEIVQLHASTVPNATTITLQSATSFAHNRGDVIRFIPYNQISLDRSTDAGATFSVEVNLVNIRADSIETYLQRASDASTDVYKFRFYNSTSATYSPYSDKTTSSGYADNSVYSIIKRAMDGMNETFTELITKQKLLDFLSEARRELDQDKRVFRWPFRTKFMSSIGTITSGTWSITAPSDLRDVNTNKNILNLYIGKDKRPMIYQDRYRFDENYQNIAHTTVKSTYSSGGTSLTLTSSNDFLQTTGSIVVSAPDNKSKQVTIAYTANNITTGVLTIPAGTANIAAGADVWQSANFGEASAYTLDSGIIYFDIPFGDSFKGQNILMDYYTTLSALVNDNSTLDEPEYDMFVSYIKYRIKYLKLNGKIDSDTDPDYKEWINRKDDFVIKQITGVKIHFVPDVNGAFGGGTVLNR